MIEELPSLTEDPQYIPSNVMHIALWSKINELIVQSNRQEELLDLMAKQVMKNLTE